jgi:hypothetical protein
MQGSWLGLVLAACAASAAAAQPFAGDTALIARAKSLELDTPYVPPPGDPLEHHTAGYAKVMCSAVFITGLDPDFAATREHSGARRTDSTPSAHAQTSKASS